MDGLKKAIVEEMRAKLPAAITSGDLVVWKVSRTSTEFHTYYHRPRSQESGDQTAVCRAFEDDALPDARPLCKIFPSPEPAEETS